MPEPTDWPSRDLLTHRVAATPARTAIIDASEGRSLTFAALDRLVDGLTSRLTALATGPPDRVGLLLSTRVATATVLHAVHRGGGTAVLFDPTRPAATLADQVDTVGASLLICEASTAETGREVGAETGVTVASVDETGHETVRNLDWNEDSGDVDVAPASHSRSDEAVIAFTSGTTGQPAGVRLTIGNLVASATASAYRLGTAPTDRWLCCLPMHHLGGLSPVLRCTLAGSTLVVASARETDAIASALARWDITGVSLVPTQVRRLLAADWTPPETLRVVLLGGAPASPDLLETALAAGVPVHPTYGTTETASQIATALPAEVRDNPGTVGQPLLFTEIAVVDDGGQPVPPGDHGEIVVDGPTVTPGYLEDARTTDAFGPAGFRTGDVGYRDEAGRLWVVGRRDDRIVTGGETVQPEVVTSVLRDHPAVAEAAVVGLPDEEWGERIAALVVATGVTVDDLRGHCRGALPDYAVPKTIVFTEALPRTASGTVDREAVRAQLSR